MVLSWNMLGFKMIYGGEFGGVSLGKLWKKTVSGLVRCVLGM